METIDKIIEEMKGFDVSIINTNNIKIFYSKLDTLSSIINDKIVESAKCVDDEHTVIELEEDVSGSEIIKQMINADLEKRKQEEEEKKNKKKVKDEKPKRRKPKIIETEEDKLEAIDDKIANDAKVKDKAIEQKPKSGRRSRNVKQ